MDLKIPFRCPHCGDTQKFDTLQDLRHHLEGQHSYRSRRRINLSNGSSFSGRHSPLMELFHADAQKLEESLRKYKEDELNNKRIRRENVGTHLTKSPAYSERKHFKEKVRDGNQHRFKNYPVETAIYNVGAHKQQSFISGALSDSDVEFYPTKLENLHSIPLYSRSNPRNLGERHVKETLSSLSHEVMHERATQQATADSLYSTEELLINVEQAAEIKIAQQQRVIETLAEKLKFKEKRLEMITKQIENLGQQQIENLEKAHKLQEQSDYTTELLQQQLLQKQKELDALNLKMEKMHDYFNKGDKPEKLKLDESTKGFKLVNEKNLHDTDTPKDFRLQNLRSPTIQHVADNVSNPGILIDSPRRTIPADTNSKDKELILIKTKAHQLDRDRQNLLFEMQSLLETAALDNEKLQSELESQRQELSQLNSELEHSKHEQTELLGETNALYHQADVSLAKLKTLLKEREHQLASLTNSLEQARSTQARLAQERDECLKLAAEREAIYQTKISSNKVQVKEMKETLDNSLSEKKKLEKDLIKLKTELDAKDGKDKQLLEKMAVLKAKLTEREKSQAKLKEELKKREEKLKKAKHEMQRMTNYLKDTAEKEIEARAKLETFISGLIDRAGQAEEELERLKASFGHSLQHAATPRKHKRDITGALDLSSLPGVSPTGSPMPQAGDFSTSVSEEEPSESNFQKHSTLLKGQISPVYKRRTEIDRHRGRQEHDQSINKKLHETINVEVYVDGDSALDDQNDGSECCSNCMQDYPAVGSNFNQLRQISLQKEPAPPALQLCSNCQQQFHLPRLTQASPTQGHSSLQHQVYTSSPQHTLLNAHHRPLSLTNLQEPVHYLDNLHSFTHPDTNSMRMPSSQPHHSSYSMHQNASQLNAKPLHLSSSEHQGMHFSNFNPTHSSNNSLFASKNKSFSVPDINNRNLYSGAMLGRGSFFSGQAVTRQHLQPPLSYNNTLTHSDEEDLYKRNLYDKNYDSPHQNTNSLFENTPEVATMFENLSKNPLYTQYLDVPSLPGFHVRGYRTGNHSRQPPEKELDRSAGLSIDENGILWEQVPSSGFSPLSKSSRKNFPGRPAKQGNMELFKLGDDTDVDEDLTDYLNEDELKSYDQNSKVKLSPINKAKISSLQKDPIPLGDKIAKLLTSLNPTESAAREDYHKNLYTQNLKQPTHASKAANEYSSEESSPSSPLHKAQQVQKRVEQLTNERPKFVNTLSKQSYGFDVSQLDSDLSVSSYASLSQVKNQHREAHVKPIEKNEETKPLEEDVMVATHVKRGPKNPSLTVEPIEAPAASTPAKGSLGAKIHNKPEPEAGVPKHQPDEKSTQAKEEFTLPKICNAKENEKIDLPIQTDTKDTKETNVPKVSNITTFDQSVKNVNAASQEKQTHEPAKEADEDLAKYQDVELKPARELRVRTLNSATSEEDLLDSESKEKQETLVEEVTDNSNTHDAAEFIGDTSLENFTDDTEGPAFNPKRKESVDASTDTDLEKLAKPGYLQKGLTVKKNVPTVKFIRKKRKQRPPLKQTHSQELLSSDTEDLDDNEKIKQAALRRMRIALFRVFAYLDTASLLVASTVCREWRKVSRHPALWKSVWLENKTISSSFLLTLSQWCTQTQAFTLQGHNNIWFEGKRNQG
ncbi:uncharacterized protein LOC131955327 isoform X2 [Physella acuta]|uniref:uncharacterized protein LOC131955327 isoform X2 n=1 Tax=Physella acuta TaxID=109671 RepID=UPI0027DC3271|nr:uncharacterized protein LOC131955327 isoform X2 [Physella acuta]